MEQPPNVEFTGYLTNELKTQGLLKAVHEKIRVIALTDIKSVVKLNEADGTPIVPVAHTVTRLINIFRILRRCALDILSAQELAAILETSLRVNSIFDAIRTFDQGVVSSLNAPRTVQDIAVQTETVAAAAFQILGGIVAKTFYAGDYFLGQVDGAGEHFSQIMSLSIEARETLTDIQRLAHFEISNKYEEQFDKDAAEHNKASWAWTFGVVGCVVAAIADITISGHQLEQHLRTVLLSKVIVLETGQVTALAFIFYFMTFCAKNALAHRNQELAAKQRRTTLKMANAAAGVATSQSFKDDILTKAALATYPGENNLIQRP